MLAVVGILSYLVWDYLQFKKDISENVTTSTRTSMNEKSERLSNIKYVVDQVNSVNTDVYNTVASNMVVVTNNTLDLADQTSNIAKNVQNAIDFRVNNTNISLTSQQRNVKPDINFTTKVSSTNGIEITKSDPGSLIQKDYDPRTTALRYGVGQYPNGTLRVYAAKGHAPSSINLSIAKENNTFDDVLTVRNNNTVNITGNLSLKGGVSTLNPNNLQTQFPFTDGKNYIRGNTEVVGNANFLGQIAVQSNLQVNGNMFANGTVSFTQGIRVNNADPGPLIQKDYDVNVTSKRYGIGQFPNSALRVYTAQGYAPATLNLSIAKSNNTFDDILQIKNSDRSVNISGGQTNINGNLQVTGNATFSRGISITSNDPGAFIEKNYNPTTTSSRYGIGQFPNGTMRMYAAKASTPATVNLSLAGDNNTFDDILQVKNDRSVNVNGKLCLGTQCLEEADVTFLKSLIPRPQPVTSPTPQPGIVPL